MEARIPVQLRLLHRQDREPERAQEHLKQAPATFRVTEIPVRGKEHARMLGLDVVYWASRTASAGEDGIDVLARTSYRFAQTPDFLRISQSPMRGLGE